MCSEVRLQFYEMWKFCLMNKTHPLHRCPSDKPLLFGSNAVNLSIYPAFSSHSDKTGTLTRDLLKKDFIRKSCFSTVNISVGVYPNAVVLWILASHSADARRSKVDSSCAQRPSERMKKINRFLFSIIYDASPVSVELQLNAVISFCEQHLTSLCFY